MKGLVASCLLLLIFCPVQARSQQPEPPSTASAQNEETWVTMPAGARSAYMGIHGGTMPVSLMVSDDGASLLTFVGRTGNDFLDILRRTDVPVPSLFNATAQGAACAATEASLSAGASAGSMPVINAGAQLVLPPLSHLEPFGLSDKPLAIEGQVSRPTSHPPVKRYRLFFEPQYLQPRRNTSERTK